MRKITLCIITLFCCISVFAQREYEYIPLVREGVEWGYYNYRLFADKNYVDPYRIQFKGDAIIDGKTYKKVYAYYSCTLNEDDADLVGWIREENKQVFFIINPQYDLLKHTQFFNSDIMPGVEYMIYDFTPEQVGDKITLWNEEITVESIEEIEINGKKHKQYKYGRSWLFPVVDGFGYVNDGGGNVVLPGSDMITNGTQYSCLNYVKVVNGDYLYTRPDFNLNFTDPCSDYTPLVREGVEWGYYNYSLFADKNYVDPYRIQFKGDAIIDGKTYKKVYAYYSCTLNEADADLVGWIREENKQVFFIINPQYDLLKHTYFYKSDVIPGKEYMIYNFTSLQAGDRVTLWNEELQVYSIEEIGINGKKHKQYSYREGTWTFPVIDGLGYINFGGGNVVLPGQPIAANGNLYSCLNYVKAVYGDYLYTSSDFNKNFIDPCLGSVANVGQDNLKLLQNEEAITIIPSNKAMSTIQLVDVAGAVVYNNIFEENDSVTISTTGFAPGVYIVILSNETEKATCKIIIK